MSEIFRLAWASGFLASPLSTGGEGAASHAPRQLCWKRPPSPHTYHHSPRGKGGGLQLRHRLHTAKPSASPWSPSSSPQGFSMHLIFCLCFYDVLQAYLPSSLDYKTIPGRNLFLNLLSLQCNPGYRMKFVALEI